MKVKVYRCRWFEADCDDLSRNYWCHNPNCPTRECWCHNPIEHVVCPGFEKSGKPVTVEYTKEEIDNIQNAFVKKILKELNEDFDESLREATSIMKRQTIIRNAMKKIQNWRPPCVVHNMNV